jgi:hypothetical protein
MTIEELQQVCADAVEKGYGNNKVIFDTEAVRFMTHGVIVHSAYLDNLLTDNDLILHFNPSAELYER